MLGQNRINMDKETFDRIAKALADPKRFEILQMIAESSEIRCADVQSRVCISQPTVSHHVKELSNSGLIEVTREANGNRFQVNRELLNEYLAEVSRKLALA